MKKLRRLPGKPKRRQFAVLDLEARQWVEPYAAGLYDGRVYQDFTDYDFQWLAVDDLLNAVLTPRLAGWWIYAHNGGNYDFLFLLQRLIVSKRFRGRFTIDIVPIGSTIVSFTVEERRESEHLPQCVDPMCRGCEGKNEDSGQRMKWTFVDSARLMPISLDELGDAFGLGRKTKLDMSYDELALPKNEGVMRAYLERDCRLLHEAVTKMVESIESLGGQVGITLPATALDLFRRRFQKEDIAISRHSLQCKYSADDAETIEKEPGEEECKGCLHSLIREAYAGGRTEIFRMHFKPYVNTSDKAIDVASVYDFSSHYPACMLEPMPVGDAIELEGLSEADIYSNSKRYVGIVDCDVEIPEDCYLPPLPKRGAGGKLLFPTGRLRGVWDASELSLLPRVGGRIAKTYRSIWFETSPVFSRFVKQLYKLRDKTSAAWNKGLDWIAKILMNSLYGKFAMREARTKIVVRPDSPEGLELISLEGDIWAEEAWIAPSYVIPQLSVHVTALARIKLWERMHDVVEQGGRIYYCDTDSETVSDAAVQTGSGLGELKHEGDVKRAAFTLPKLYLYEWAKEPTKSKKKREKALTVKAKGMSSGIRMSDEAEDEYGGELSEAEFDSLVRGLPVERKRLVKLREGLREYTKNNLVFPRVIPVKKHVVSPYDKRRVLPDGDTVPLVFHDW